MTRNGPVGLRAKLDAFTRFLGDTFFDGKKVELTAEDESHGNHRRVLVYVDGGEERTFFDLGDGIQAIIVLMYKLFLAEPGTWVFIEEPELNLHPGLQRIFFEVLATDKKLVDKNLTVFITTHSNHLLGMAIPGYENVSVFGFQRAPDSDRFYVRSVHNRHQNALALLGVANSSVFLANCSIWVEGVTDRQYLRAYLKAYQCSNDFRNANLRTLREDMHYAFYEYAGSNLAHYFFETDGIEDEAEPTEAIKAQFIANRIFLLADRDVGKEEKHAARSQLNGPHFRYFATPGIEVENLVAPSLLAEILPRLISSVKLVFDSRNPQPPLN